MPKTETEVRGEYIEDEITEQSFTAGELLSGQKLLMLINGKVYLFDPTVDSNASKILGFAKASAQPNSSVQVVMRGSVDIGSLNQGDVYYAGPSGSITNTLPSSGVLMQVGEAISSSSLQINITQPIILA